MIEKTDVMVPITKMLKGDPVQRVLKALQFAGVLDGQCWGVELLDAELERGGFERTDVDAFHAYMVARRTESQKYETNDFSIVTKGGPIGSMGFSGTSTDANVSFRTKNDLDWSKDVTGASRALASAKKRYAAARDKSEDVDLTPRGRKAMDALRLKIDFLEDVTIAFKEMASWGIKSIHIRVPGAC